jgi:hypothetical protein
MSQVCDCPFCGQPAAIPEDLDSDAVVRCPHCQYEFVGDRALMYAVEAPPEHIAELPPTLVVLRDTEDAAAPQEPGVEGTQVPDVQGPSEAVLNADASTEATVGEFEASQAIAEGPKEEAESSPATAQDGGERSEPSQATTDRPEAGTEPSQAVAEEPEADTDLSPATVDQTPPAAPIATAAAPEPSAVSDTSDVSATPPSEPTEQKPSETVEPASGPVSAEATPPGTLGEAPFGEPAPAWRERQKGNPVRTAIGSVLSGLLGLAVAWLVLSKLGFIGQTNPPAIEAGNGSSESKSARPDSALTPPPEPKAFDEWPGLDENRFTGEPKEAKKNVQPPRPAKKGTSGSGQF